MKKLFLFAAAISLPHLIFAYPITPRPLRMLVLESELIVWGHVLEVGKSKTNKKEYAFMEDDYAVIEVKDVLQGNIRSKTIKVLFNSHMICPAPGVFFEGEMVLAFVNETKKNKEYYVGALSYGVKHGLTLNDYNIYKRRIEEMQKITKEKKSYAKIVEWLVKCAEEKCTSWEGTYELSSMTNFNSNDDCDAPKNISLLMTSGQQKRLWNALSLTDTISYKDIGLISLVMGLNDSLLLDFLKIQLTKFDRSNFWTAGIIMDHIVDLTGCNDLKTISDKFETILYSSRQEDQDNSQKLFLEFLEKMKDKVLKKAIVGSVNYMG